MGTPERVSSEPNLPVPLPCLSPHQVAILVRGLDRHLEILGRLRGCMSADGFAERSGPAHAVREKAAAALGEWCAREGWVRVEGDDGVLASWPSEPAVTLPVCTLAEVWAARLGVDFAAMLEFDREQETGHELSREQYAPLAALGRVLVDTLAAVGVEDACPGPRVPSVLWAGCWRVGRGDGAGHYCPQIQNRSITCPTPVVPLTSSSTGSTRIW